MGETTTRFLSVMSPSRNGANIGARPGAPPARDWNQSSAAPSHSGSRRRRFSWLIRWLRVSSE